MNKKNKIIIASISSLLIIGLAIFYFFYLKQKEDYTPPSNTSSETYNTPNIYLYQQEDYNWLDEKNYLTAKQIINQDWNIYPLSNKIPNTTFNLSKTTNCADLSDENRTYLYVAGGKCQLDYWLEAKQNNKIIKIDTYPKLLEILGGKIDTLEKATLFVNATFGDVKRQKDLLIAKTLEINNEFFVQVTEENSFGCEDHLPTVAIYKINEDGSTDRIAEQIQTEEPGPEVCID